jgi:hypothetical protein
MIMQGNLSQISLNDILLLATGAKKSGVLKFSRGKETVEVYFIDGSIVHATCPIGDGEKALVYPVTWGEGTFALSPNGAAPTATIHKSTAEILDEVKAMSREWETILEVIPSGKRSFVSRIWTKVIPSLSRFRMWHGGFKQLDGARTVQEVAELLRIPYAYAAKVFFNLYKSGLIDIITPSSKPAGEPVPEALIRRLAEILTEVIGPMAPVVLRDQIESLGESSDTVPDSKLDDLIAEVSREIADTHLRQRFVESAGHEIANFKKF